MKRKWLDPGILLLFVLAGSLWAGYSSWTEMDVFGGVRKYPSRDGIPLSEDPNDPITAFVSDSVAFVQASLKNCSPNLPDSQSGSPITGQDLGNKLQDAFDNGRINIEGNEGANSRSLASARNWPPSGPQGIKGSYDNGQEGINFNPDIYPGDPPSQTEIAIMAGFLAHEAFHLAWGTTGVPGAEKAAYQAQAEFLCCAIQYAQSQGMGQEVVGALCQQLAFVWRRYYCVYDGKEPLPDCGCSILHFLCPMIARSPLNIYPNYQAVPLFPRGPVDPGTLTATHAFYGSLNGFFEAGLYPASIGGELMVSRFDGVTWSQWSFSVSNQQEGTFIPLVLTYGGVERVFMTGRIHETGKTILYDVNIHWNGVAPVPSFKALYYGTGLGDITGLGFLSEAPDTIIAFDWTNARLSYITISSGTVAYLANRTTYPDLALMIGLQVRPGKKSNGTVDSIGMFLQPVQVYQNQPQGWPGMIELRFLDRFGDGTIDAYQRADF